MTFEEFKFHPDIMQGIRDMRFVDPTPIQAQSIPPALEGRDLIANAQTGSGKTAAFLLPLMQRIIEKPMNFTRVLVLAPTRELACQIDEQAVGFGYRTPIKSVAVYGGAGMSGQESALRAGTTIVIATPGRLLDHHRYGSWKFEELEALVLDEADRMLDMGLWPDIQSIMNKLPKKKQTLLFSATMPKPIVELAKTFMHEPAHIKIGLVRPPSTINQHLYPVSAQSKTDLLAHLIKKTQMDSALIFVGTKIGAAKLHRHLERIGIHTGLIHGDLEQKDRNKVLNLFRTGKVKLLVATDVASRGIDIAGISHVVNFDMPYDADTYIHRIGRTARAEAQGDALTFFTKEEEDRVREIEKAAGKTIPRRFLPEFQTERQKFYHPGQGRPQRKQFRSTQGQNKKGFRRGKPDSKNTRRSF